MSAKHFQADFLRIETLIEGRDGAFYPLAEAVPHIASFDCVEGIVEMGGLNREEEHLASLSDEVFSLWRNLERFAADGSRPYRFRNETQRIGWAMFPNGEVVIGGISGEDWTSGRDRFAFEEVYFRQRFERVALLRGLAAGAREFREWTKHHPGLRKRYEAEMMRP